MAQTTPKTGFEKWQDGLNKALDDAAWNAWDCEIQTAVGEYNRHLAGTTGYQPLDWQMIKAMLWVETGANSPEWNIKPMQIGVTGDPGMTSLLSATEGGDVIVPPLLKPRLTVGAIRSTPAINIRAGIGYLLMRLAHFEHQSIVQPGASVTEITVKAGDSLDKIAKANGSTMDVLKKLNPGASVLRPGQTLKVQKASVQRVITGWRQISTTLIAQRYNGGGDPNYAKKLDYTLSLVRNGEAAVCAQ